MTIKLRLFVPLLLAVLAADVFSQPNEWRQGERDAVRAFHAQYSDIDRNWQNNNSQAQRSAEGTGSGSAGANDTHENAGMAVNRDNSSESSGSSSRRAGKLSEEERRALRRQIDEAGHDIYSRKR